MNVNVHVAAFSLDKLHNGTRRVSEILNIQATPTFILYHKGNALREAVTNRTTDGFIDFLRKSLTDTSLDDEDEAHPEKQANLPDPLPSGKDLAFKKLHSAAEYQIFIRNNENACVLLYSKKQGNISPTLLKNLWSNFRKQQLAQGNAYEDKQMDFAAIDRESSAPLWEELGIRNDFAYLQFHKGKRLTFGYEGANMNAFFAFQQDVKRTLPAISAKA